MSSVVNCPKCRKSVSLPAEVVPNTWVRCPLCLAKYQFEQVLSTMPPMLEVIAAPPGASMASMMDDEPEFESSFEEQAAEAPPISSAAMAAKSSGANSPGFAAGIMELDEDEDTLPAMEAGSLASAGGMPDFHETHGFREAPEDGEEDSGVLELQPEADAGEWRAPPVAAEPAVGVKSQSVARRKKPRGNPILEGVKIVVGGGLGLAIGYAVLMWGFKQDPLKLAEILPPAIVPASLQPASRVAQAPPAPSSNSTDPWGGAAKDNSVTNAGNEPTLEPMPMNEPMPETPPAGQPPLDDDLGSLPGVEPAPPMEKPMPGALDPAAEPMPMPGDSNPMPGPEPMPMPAETPPTAAPPDVAPAPSPSETPMPEPEPARTKTMKPEPSPLPDEPAAPMTDPSAPAPMTEPPSSAPKTEPANPTESPASSVPMPMPEDDFPPPPKPKPMPVEPGVGPKGGPKFSLEQVNAAVTAAREAASAVESAPADLPDADRKKLRVAAYRSFAELAEAITLLDDSADNAKAARAAAMAMLQSTANNMPMLNQIGKLGGIWMTSMHRKGNGIVMAGRVQQTTPAGKVFRTEIVMLGHDRPNEAGMVIVSAEEPKFKLGEIAVVLGTIVQAPAINVHDYEGNDDTVIWASAIGLAQLEATK